MNVIQGYDRVQKILELLRLDHLSASKKEYVINIVRLHSDRFYILGEYLNKTNLQTHKIVTTDDLPMVFTANNTVFPQCKELTRQVQELMSQDIVTHSVFPYNFSIWIVSK